MTAEKPTLVDVLDVASIDIRARVRTIVPARVIAYDPATRLATVQPLRKRRMASGAVIDEAVIPARPVIWPRAGLFILDWDLLPGDGVALLVCDRESDALVTGSPVPMTGRMHSLTDCLVLPGVFPELNPPTHPKSPGQAYLGTIDGSVRIALTPAALAQLEAPLIQLGATAVEPVTLATSLIAAIDAMLLAGLGGAIPTDGGVGAFTAATTAWNSAKAQAIAAKVLAE